MLHPQALLWGMSGSTVSATLLMQSQPWLLELHISFYSRLSKAENNGCLFTFVILKGVFKAAIKVLVAVMQQGVCVTGTLVLNFGAREGTCQPPPLAGEVDTRHRYSRGRSPQRGQAASPGLAATVVELGSGHTSSSYFCSSSLPRGELDNLVPGL